MEFAFEQEFSSSKIIELNPRFWMLHGLVGLEARKDSFCRYLGSIDSTTKSATPSLLGQRSVYPFSDFRIDFCVLFMHFRDRFGGPLVGHDDTLASPFCTAVHSNGHATEFTMPRRVSKLVIMAHALRHLLVVTDHFPSPLHPDNGMFVGQLVRAIEKRGVHCTTIHPFPIHEWVQSHLLRRAAETKDDAAQFSPIRPVYLSASSRQLGSLNAMHITQAMFQGAVLRGFRNLHVIPDATYGHFLYPGGAAAVWMGKQLNRPSFIAVGESLTALNTELWSVRPIGKKRAQRDLHNVTGVIAVSALLKNKLIQDLSIPADKIQVFPNGADRDVFFPRDRQQMRSKYSLPLDQFLVVFVGDFNERKGTRRVSEAISYLDGVAGVFVGSGSIDPSGPNHFVLGIQPHSKIPEILSAADVFVLPTLAEGSCNSIIEAMACGLPIITSIGEFNDELVDDSVAIRVNPMNVLAIREAVTILRDNAVQRNRMAAAALARAEQFDLNRRADRICSWIECRI